MSLFYLYLALVARRFAAADHRSLESVADRQTPCRGYLAVAAYQYSSDIDPMIVVLPAQILDCHFRRHFLTFDDYSNSIPHTSQLKHAPQTVTLARRRVLHISILPIPIAFAFTITLIGLKSDLLSHLVSSLFLMTPLADGYLYSFPLLLTTVLS